MVAQLSMFDGVAERDRILAAMRENHAVYLTTLRSFAREHALRNGLVTIDDVRDIIEARAFPMPGEIGADERVFGTVFNRSEFEAVDQRQTRRQEWAKRVGRARSFVTVYRLKEDRRAPVAAQTTIGARS